MAFATVAGLALMIGVVMRSPVPPPEISTATFSAPHHEEAAQPAPQAFSAPAPMARMAIAPRVESAPAQAENAVADQPALKLSKRALPTLEAGLQEIVNLRRAGETRAADEKLLALREDLESFGVTFDEWFSERSLFEDDAVAAACRELREKGHAYDKDGAFWLRSTDFGDDKDRVIIRDNGIPTYFASDIAYHDNKFRRGFETVINIWGADHHGYIPRMKAAVAALGYDPARLEVLVLQMVSLYQGGELVKMSKRTGQGVTLTELIEEVGRDAARYFFIMRSLDSQLDFDLDLAKSHSNDNPVYYVQYAHARIASIFRQMAEAGIAFDSRAKAELKLLSTPFEQDLIRKLGDYPEEVSAAARDRAPHRIARFAHELAGLFHSFYNGCRVLGVEPELTIARLALVAATQRVLKHALSILGVDAPEKM